VGSRQPRPSFDRGFDVVGRVGDTHRLPEQCYRLVRVVQCQPCPAQIIKRVGLYVPVSDVAGDSQRLDVLAFQDDLAKRRLRRTS
jgi:hypothetical protein